MSTPSFTTSYKKSLGKNYMTLDPILTENLDNASSYTKNFRVCMIHENTIPGLLSTHVQYVDDIPSFQYDITGMQSLEIILDTAPLTYTILCKICIALYNSLLSIENYLLLHEHILLSPEYIYLTADYADIRFCYCPLKKESISDSVRSFFDYLLKKVLHSDEKCVYLAYSMHKSCNDNDFNINKLYEHLSYIPNDITPVATSVVTPIETTASHNERDISTSSLKNITTETLAAGTNYTAENYTEKNSPELKIKIMVLLIFSVLSFITSTALYLYAFFNLSFYLILLLTVAIIICYNSYHLHRQYGNTKLQTLAAANQRNHKTFTDHDATCNSTNTSRIKKYNYDSCYNFSTVLLADAADTNTHKLIYTGTDDGEDITLAHYPFVIGKTDACSARLNNSAISRIHAKISLLPIDSNSEDIFIEDLNSTNGTLLNNIPLAPYEKYPITSGDHITFGHLTYIFR